MENVIEKNRRFYEKYVAELIHGDFAEYEDRIAVGIAGEGSDCFGYDDEVSRLRAASQKRPAFFDLAGQSERKDEILSPYAVAAYDGDSVFLRFLAQGGHKTLQEGLRNVFGSREG